MTALIWASSNGHDEMVEMLLTAGADIEATDDVSCAGAGQAPGVYADA